MQPYLPFAATVLAYLLGSLSFAVIVSRLMGLGDPRSYGSGNPGATNVLRSGNKLAAALTLLFDALKGFLPVLAVLLWGAPHDLCEGTAAADGFAAFTGHVWPVFFGFKGGKGVATALGVLLALNPWLGAATLATWLAVALVSRYSSLAAIVAAVCAPLYQLMAWDSGPVAIAVTLMGMLLIWRHGGNIAKLMAGTESKLGGEASAAASAGPSSPASAPTPPARAKPRRSGAQKAASPTPKK